VTKTPAPPAYKSLADELRRDILAGRFQAGQQLPTEIELAEKCRLSRQTVRRAFQELVAESLIYRVRGRGTFAVPALPADGYARSVGSIDELLAVALDTELRVVDPFTPQSDVAVASRLQLETDRVMVGVFVRLFEQVPFAVTVSHVPVEIGKALLEDGKLAQPGASTPDAIIALIEQVMPDIVIAGAQQSINAVIAPPHTQEILGCAPQDPVLQIDRLYYSRDGRRVQLAISHFHPKRYAYRLELRRST
jgi:DNA-binding GntR family transcriptional regulator